MEPVRELLQGAYDFHCHVGPDRTPRRFDGPGMARHYADAGFAGAVLKDHWFPSTAACQAARQSVPGFNAISAVALNHAMGGLNAAGLETAARSGLQMVFFPTSDAGYHRDRYPDNPPGGIRILQDDGRLIPAAEDCLAVAAKYRLLLGTGHLSPAESVALCTRARELGIERMVATHVSMMISAFPLTQQKQLAALGVKIEHCALGTIWRHGAVSAAEIAAQIHGVGPEHCLLSTDLGQVDNPPPAEGYARFVTELLAAGITPTEIRRMACENPAALAPA